MFKMRIINGKKNSNLHFWVGLSQHYILHLTDYTFNKPFVRSWFIKGHTCLRSTWVYIVLISRWRQKTAIIKLT